MTGSAGRVAQVRTALASAAGMDPAGIEPRVAASVSHLGVAARVLAPIVGLAVLGPEPDLSVADLYWQARLGGPFPLSLPAEVSSVMTSGRFVETVAADLVDAVHTLVSPHVLWGNVASAIAGAGAMIGTARPHLAPRAAEVVSAALATPPLRSEWDRTEGRFRRRSCCLMYRIAAVGGPSYCGDCVLLGS